MAGNQIGELRKSLGEHGQEHVLRFWPDLAEGVRRNLSKQLQSIDPGLLDRLARGEGVFAPDPDTASIEEPEVVTLPAGAEDEARRAAAAECGLEEMRAGRVAVLVVAGGQGTRLGFDGPKGAFPVGRSPTARSSGSTPRRSWPPRAGRAGPSPGTS